jgi:hypothetical protein
MDLRIQRNAGRRDNTRRNWKSGSGIRRFSHGKFGPFQTELKKRPRRALRVDPVAALRYQ